MYNQAEFNEFKQQVADYFNQRSNYDNEGEFHPRLAHSLVEYAGIRNRLLSFNASAETAFITSVVLVTVAKRHNLVLPAFDRITGTAQKCYALLQAAGFKDIAVKTDQLGSYISMSQAQWQWEKMLQNPLVLQQLSSAQLEQLKAECFRKLEALVTDKGIWNDITTFSVLGRKGVDSRSVSW